MHLNCCSRSHKIRESLSNWILWRQEGSLLIFFYSHIHNKFALAILGFQWLWVCYLCSYVWIDHFQQIAKFLFCADWFVLDLCNKHVLKSHPVCGHSLERYYYQFGQFCCGWMGFFLQFQPFMCHFSDSASIFSCHIVACALFFRKHNSVKRCSSSCCCSCFASNCFLSIFLYISSCLLFKNFASFSFSTRNNGIPGLHVLLPLSHLLSRYIMIYFHFLCLWN